MSDHAHEHTPDGCADDAHAVEFYGSRIERILPHAKGEGVVIVLQDGHRCWVRLSEVCRRD